jgi:hypothetical protein
MISVLLFLFVSLTYSTQQAREPNGSTDAGLIDIWYFNNTQTHIPCQTYPICYSMACKIGNFNDGDIIGLYFRAHDHYVCDFHDRNPSKNHTAKLTLIANDKDGSYLDAIRCVAYYDCMHKVCLLSNEPGVVEILLAFYYGSYYDCK